MTNKVKTFIVAYRSKIHPLEGLRKMRVTSTSKSQIRNDFPALVGSDEYRIVVIHEEGK